MKKKDFFEEVDKRLNENVLLGKESGVGKFLGPVSDVVNEHLFWVLLIASGLITFWWMNSEWVSKGSSYFFGWLYL